MSEFQQVKTLIKPWKGLKQEDTQQQCSPYYCENPNKTLEGIKTVEIQHKRRPLYFRENPNKTLEGIKTGEIAQEITVAVMVKTLIKPWKGLKPGCGDGMNARRGGVKTLIKPWKGLKPLTAISRACTAASGENPNKTLEGIKTPQVQAGALWGCWR
ncbi:hypothetical protein U27_01417 [Candidatus Vecturithrix granuli]|uniref:Uncharacterized protein n=1 Tax=Vecturithrix granuli TaxID=1499967 RepID=A0A081CAB1_VECG1|nr:hypothetical protein U27_01417 [Candidatus Vecturithrix granuli]